MRDAEKILTGARASLREVLAVIDRGALEIAVVVGADGRPLGTVTDGDIRRAILRGLPLDTAAEEVMNSNFTAVGVDASPREVLTLMRARWIKQVPVLDAVGRIVGIHVLPDLVKNINRRPNWAVIMAGGEGRRLRPLTEKIPKPMLPVGDRPLLERIITRLVEHGFQRIFLSINYLGAAVEEHFGDGRRLGCSIAYLRETRPLGTGGALRLLPDDRPAAPLLVANGDLLTELNFSALMDYHAQQAHDATLCVREFNYQVPYGVVNLNGESVVSMVEKPLQRFFINAGVYVIEPELLSLIPPGVEYHLPTLLEAAGARGKAVGAFPVREYWLDIGQLEDYEAARHLHAAGEGER